MDNIKRIDEFINKLKKVIKPLKNDLSKVEKKEKCSEEQINRINIIIDNKIWKFVDEMVTEYKSKYDLDYEDFSYLKSSILSSNIFSSLEVKEFSIEDDYNNKDTKEEIQPVKIEKSLESVQLQENVLPDYILELIQEEPNNKDLAEEVLPDIKITPIEEETIEIQENISEIKEKESKSIDETIENIDQILSKIDEFKQQIFEIEEDTETKLEETKQIV